MEKKALGQGSISYNNGAVRIIKDCTLVEVANQAWADGDHVEEWDWIPYKEQEK